VRSGRALVGIGAPTEARFFQFVGAFGVAIAAVYWFVSYEPAGSVLLLAFGGASGLVGTALAAASRGRRPTVQERRSMSQPGVGRRPDDATPRVIEDSPADAMLEGRPFLDESGRIPAPTLAPFAVGTGVSIAALSLIFGPAPLLAGAVPLAWGVLAWLHRARSEYDATETEPDLRRP
jgi:hypothetical protein